MGSADADLAMTLTQYLMDRSEEELNEPNTRFIILALALLFLGTCWPKWWALCSLKFLQAHRTRAR